MTFLQHNIQVTQHQNKFKYTCKEILKLVLRLFYGYGSIFNKAYVVSEENKHILCKLKEWGLASPLEEKETATVDVLIYPEEETERGKGFQCCRCYIFMEDPMVSFPNFSYFSKKSLKTILHALKHY